MHDVNWWLMTLAFLLGLLLTLALTIRKVTREVPVTHTASAGIAKPDLGKVAGATAVAGAAAVKGAAGKVEKKAAVVEKKVEKKAAVVEKKVAEKVAHAEKAVAKKVEQADKKIDRVEKTVTGKAEDIEHILEKEPYGAGSIRVSRRAVAPAGYTIKGDKDTGRYFTLDSPEYEAIEAEVWFANEASAEKAGFLRWDATGTHKVGLVAGAETVVTEKHVAAETVITEKPSTADSTLVIVDDGIPETKTVIVDDGIPETKIRIIGLDD